MRTDKPNILLIVTDQQRLSTMSCYDKQTVCKTPNLNKLAEESIRFENSYTACPLCSPARGSIITGLYPHNHGVTTNIGEIGCSVNNLPDSEILLSRKLMSAGYNCGYTGKWHLGSNNKDQICGQRRKTKDGTCKNLYSNEEIKNSIPEDVGFKGQNFEGHGGGGHGYQ